MDAYEPLGHHLLLLFPPVNSFYSSWRSFFHCIINFWVCPPYVDDRSRNIISLVIRQEDKPLILVTKCWRKRPPRSVRPYVGIGDEARKSGDVAKNMTWRTVSDTWGGEGKRTEPLKDRVDSALAQLQERLQIHTIRTGALQERERKAKAKAQFQGSELISSGSQLGIKKEVFSFKIVFLLLLSLLLLSKMTFLIKP